MTKEEAYDQFVSPLMKQVIALSKEHDIPMVAAFDLDDDRDAADRPGLACVTQQIPANTCRRIREASAALSTFHPPVLAITMMTSKPS